VLDVDGTHARHVRDASFHLHVDEVLWQRDHRLHRETFEWRVRAAHEVDDDDSREQPVAGRRVVAQDDVSTLLPAEDASRRLHRRKDAAISDRRRVHVDLGVAHRRMEARVRHHRHHDASRVELTASRKIESDERDHLVAVHDVAHVIHCDDAVTVAVECKTEIGGSRRSPR